MHEEGPLRVSEPSSGSPQYVERILRLCEQKLASPLPVDLFGSLLERSLELGFAHLVARDQIGGALLEGMSKQPPCPSGVK
jgi:hypothetical protein